MNTEQTSKNNFTYTSFQGKRMPKENASYKCLSLKLLDFVGKVNKKYYPQILLEECKYEIKKTKAENLNNDGLEPSSSNDASDNELENESNNEYEINLLINLTINNLLMNLKVKAAFQ